MMNASARAVSPEEVLEFWFVGIERRLWFTRDDALDRKIAEDYGALHARAAVCELEPWRSSLPGRLAEILVLDQFSRNLYRGDARAFAQDPLALALAQEVVRSGRAGELPPEQRAFLYLPYMHSESLVVHEQAVPLFAEPGLEENLAFERRHIDILKRFGRYPHRNAVLGRTSSEAELEFLNTPGSSF